MITIQDVLISLFITYWFTGFEMMLSHTSEDEFDPPAYTYKPPLQRFFFGLMWPYIAYLNKEFGWHLICFVSSSIVFCFYYILVNQYLEATFLSVLVITTAKLTPLSFLFNLLATMIALPVWFLIGKPLGWSIPDHFK